MGEKLGGKAGVHWGGSWNSGRSQKLGRFGERNLGSPEKPLCLLAFTKIASLPYCPPVYFPRVLLKCKCQIKNSRCHYCTLSH